MAHPSRHCKALIPITTLFALFPIALTLRPAAASFGSTRPVEVVEETVTLTPGDAQTWQRYEETYSKLPYCGPPFKVGPEYYPPEKGIVAGFKHFYDKGAVIFGCPETLSWTFRGTVWFDLAGIVAKAPPLRVYVKSATLKFKAFDPECPVHLLLANKDWSKGLADKELPPGDSFALSNIESCGREGCSVDVQTIVNNWVRGADHGGYANYGFVIMGDREGLHSDNDVCMTRYGDFALTVTYKYEKAPPVIYVPMPSGPTIHVNPAIIDTRTNFALASNGGIASASSILAPGFPASGAINGDRQGANWGSGGGWADATSGSFPDWLVIDFSGPKKINEIDVFTLQDDYKAPVPVVEGMTFSKYGLTAFDIEYSNGSTWLPVPGGTISDNKLIWTKLKLATPITAVKIRLMAKAAIDNSYSRITEVEAWGK